MDDWTDGLRRHLGWMIGVVALGAWMGLLYLMFGDVL